MRKTARQLGHAISDESHEPVIKKRKTALEMPREVTIFQLSPRVASSTSSLKEILADGRARMENGKLYPSVPWSFALSAANSMNELRLQNIFDIKTLRYDLRPMVLNQEAGCPLTDQPGQLALFQPVVNDQSAVEDYVLKRYDGATLFGPEGPKGIMYPSLEAASLAVFVALKDPKFKLQAYQINFGTFQDRAGKYFGSGQMYLLQWRGVLSELHHAPLTCSYTA